MNAENIEILQDMLNELQQEYDDVQNRIKEKKNTELNERSQSLKEKINKLDKVIKDERSQKISVLSIQEDERYRISRDLHDTSLQNLAHLVHKIELSSLYIDNDPIRAKLELSVVNKNLKTIIEEIRNTIFNLRPMTFDDLGLKASFERLIHLMNNESKKYEILFDVEDVSCENNLVLLTVYRIVQEVLNNIVKHAEATKISFVGKCYNDMYKIVIEDNGKGFNEEEVQEKKNNHFGMALIRERINILKGRVKVQSECGKGTRIEIESPIDNDLIIR